MLFIERIFQIFVALRRMIALSISVMNKGLGEKQGSDVVTTSLFFQFVTLSKAKNCLPAMEDICPVQVVALLRAARPFYHVSLHALGYSGFAMAVPFKTKIFLCGL